LIVIKLISNLGMPLIGNSNYTVLVQKHLRKLYLLIDLNAPILGTQLPDLGIPIGLAAFVEADDKKWRKNYGGDQDEDALECAGAALTMTSGEGFHATILQASPFATVPPAPTFMK